MSNIAILRKHISSKFLDAVVDSNETKEQQLQAQAKQKQAMK
jgi:hypothetical protein